MSYTTEQVVSTVNFIKQCCLRIGLKDTSITQYIKYMQYEHIRVPTAQTQPRSGYCPLGSSRRGKTEDPLGSSLSLASAASHCR